MGRQDGEYPQGVDAGLLGLIDDVTVSRVQVERLEAAATRAVEALSGCPHLPDEDLPDALDIAVRQASERAAEAAENARKALGQGRPVGPVSEPTIMALLATVKQEWKAGFVSTYKPTQAMCDAVPVLAAEVERLQAALATSRAACDALVGERFSDRVHAALRARAEGAEAEVAAVISASRER
jgi:hypothetical protein